MKRYTVIECECKKATKEKLGRKESFRVRDNTIKVIHTDFVKPVDWASRKELIMPLKANCIEDLRDAYKEDKTSLGLIKPKEILEFHHLGEIMTDLHLRKEFQLTIEGKKVPLVTSIPHQFKYRFTCDGCNPGGNHDIQCEDWELLESYRSWGQRYTEPDDLWRHIHDKFYNYMIERDFHFFMGMHSLQPSWLIIGLFYPPFEQGEDRTGKQVTLDDL